MSSSTANSEVITSIRMFSLFRTLEFVLTLFLCAVHSTSLLCYQIARMKFSSSGRLIQYLHSSHRLHYYEFFSCSHSMQSHLWQVFMQHSHFSLFFSFFFFFFFFFSRHSEFLTHVFIHQFMKSADVALDKCNLSGRIFSCFYCCHQQSNLMTPPTVR